MDFYKNFEKVVNDIFWPNFVKNVHIRGRFLIFYKKQPFDVHFMDKNEHWHISYKIL